MPTQNLNVPYLEQNVAQPEIPENEAKDIIDAAICGILSIIMTIDTDYNLDDTGIVLPQEWQYGILVVNPISHTIVTNINIPDGKVMKYIIANDSGSGLDVNIKTVSGTGVSVPDGSVYQVFSDGISIRRIT